MSNSQTEKRTVQIILDGSQPPKTIKQIAADIKILGNHMAKNLKPGTKAFEFAAKKMRDLKTELRDANAQMRLTRAGSKKLGATFKATFMGVIGGNILTQGIQRVTRFFGKMVSESAKLSDEYADIQKTTGLTNKEVRELDRRFKTFNTRTPRSQLRKLAEEAGRLGKKGVDDIEAFVRAGDKIAVALGDDLGGNGEEAIKTVGKLAEQYQVATKEQTTFEEGMLKVGSAINEVSASGSNQASFSIDFLKRVSGVANTAKVDLQDVIGYAAAADEAGQNLEVSATTWNKVVVAMSKDVAAFAEVAGVSIEEFNELVQVDANEALLTLLDGLKGNNEGLGVMAKKLEDLGMDGARATAVLAALASNTDNIREKQELANKSLKEGTSITDEFSKRNDNLAGNLAKLRERLRSVWVNGGIMQGIAAFVSWLARAKKAKADLTQETREEIKQLAIVEIKLRNANTKLEEKTKLIKEIQDKYPGFLNNIDAEKASFDQVAAALQKLNGKLIDKLVIQQQDGKILDANNRKEEIQNKLAEKKLKMINDIQNLAQRSGAKLPDGADITDQAWNILHDKDARYKGKFTDENEDKHEIRRLRKAISFQMRSFKKLTAELEELEGTTKDLTNQRQSLMKTLGVTEDDMAPKVDPPGDDDSTTDTVVSPYVPEGPSDSEKERIRKQIESLYKQAQSLRTEFELSQMEQDEAEKERVRLKYQELLDDLKAHHEAQHISDADFDARKKEVEALREEELAALELSQAEKELQAKRDLFADIEAIEADEFEAEINRLEDRYDALIESAKKYGLDVVKLEQAKIDALDALRKEHNKIREADEKKEDAKALRRQKEVAAAKLRVATDLVGALDALAYLMAGQSAAYAEFSKGLALFQIGIDTATAISQALSNSQSPTPDNVATGGLAGLAKFATISAALLKAAAQAKSIFSKEQIPAVPALQYGGLLDGPSHSEGGMPVIDPRTGRKVMELEGREAVLSGSTVANNWPLVARLLDSSMNHGGASIGAYSTTPPSQFDMAAINGTVRSMESGGIVPQATSPGMPGFEQLVVLFLGGVRQFVAATNKPLGPVVVNQDNLVDLQEAFDELNSIQNSASL